MSFESADNANSNAQDKGQFGDQDKGSQTSNNAFLIVGERAFKDQDSVAKHIEHAQTHIKTLEDERQKDKELFDQMANELERLKKVEAAVSQGSSGTGDQTDHLSKDELAKRAADLAKGMIEQEQTKQQQMANMNASLAAAQAALGDDFKDKVMARAKELGMNGNAVDALAYDSPEAFKRLFVGGKAESSNQPSSGDVNSSALGQDATPQRKNIMKMSDKERREYVSTLLRQST